MPRNYNDGTYRAVTIRGYANLNYGFLSRVDSRHYDDLGQALINAQTTGLVIGCNAPKPGRATKKVAAGGTESSFYSSGSNDKTTSLKAAGWKLTAGKRRLPSRSKASASYYVEVGGVKYAWQLTYIPGGTLPSSYGSASGAKLVEENDLVVWGCSYPKPPVIATEMTGQGTFSSFADATAINSLPDEWEIKRPALFGANAATKFFT